MKKLMVYMEEEFHDAVKELAHRKKTTMAALVRYAIDLTFEDDLDAIIGERRFEEHMKDPSGTIALDDFLKERGIVLQPRTAKGGTARSKAAAR